MFTETTAEVQVYVQDVCSSYSPSQLRKTYDNMCPGAVGLLSSLRPQSNGFPKERFRNIVLTKICSREHAVSFKNRHRVINLFIHLMWLLALNPLCAFM